jgi:hypothetical protein
LWRSIGAANSASVVIMLFSVAQAAKQTGLGEFTILRAIEDGRIVGTKDLFGEWHIDEKDLDDLAAAATDAHRFEETGAGRNAVIVASVQHASDTPVDQSPDAQEHACGPLDVYDSSPHRTPPHGRNVSLEVHESRTISLQLAQSETAIHSRSTWDEIRLDGSEKISQSVPFGCRRWHVRSLPIRAILLLVVGWVGGLSSYHVYQSLTPRQELPKASNQGSVFANQVPSPADPRQGLGAEGNAKTPGKSTSSGFDRRPRRQPGSQTLAQPRNATKPAPEQDVPTQSIVTKQQDRVMAPPAHFPETRPTTVNGWTLREVVNGTALLEGPYGTWKAGRGDIVPGLGRVDSIVLWGNRWIVATSRGLVTTP